FVGISLIWGSSFLLIAIGLESLEPGLITWLRIVFGTIALALFPRARARIEPGDRARLVVLSFVWVAVPFTLFPLAQQYINSAVTGILNGGTPIFAAIVATVLLRHLPRGAQLAGLGVGFGGVALVSLARGSVGDVQALGVVLAVGATICYGLAINLAVPIQQRYGSVPVMAQMLLLASVWTAPMGIVGLFNSSFEWRPVLAVSLLGFVGTGLAFLVMATLVGRVGSTRAASSTYLIPVVATILGVVILGDDVVAFEIAGIGLVVAGAMLASRRDR
ncbi:MAG: DMT family transporter, partial [Acidimicrobiia bacterium]|nr:DMT family transporter [Acidimicrobiia bacterium]